jgi:hypothetical protein
LPESDVSMPAATINEIATTLTSSNVKIAINSATPPSAFWRLGAGRFLIGPAIY